jgi:predicted DNA-binding transcriptional regulator YafY
MSTNKHALIRYRVIDKCLRQTDKAWNWKSLAEACGVEIEKVTSKPTTLSERTIKGDLQSMRHDEALGYFAPIEYDRVEKSYYYSNRQYSITEAPLNRSDSEELKNAIGLLRQFTGFQHLAGIGNIIQKLELLAYESTSTSESIVHLAQPSEIPGQKWLDQLYEAIKEQKALAMTYKPFDREASAAIISPYLLKEYDNRWYLYAKNHGKLVLRTYGLERITELKGSLQAYKPADDFDPERYFKDIIGVTLEPNKNPQKIQLEVYGNTKNYILTKSLHKTQRIVEERKGSVVIELSLIPNYELESLIMSFGEQLKVLKPAALQKRIAKRLGSASGLY